MKITNTKILEYSKNISVLYVEDDTLLRESMEPIFSMYFNVLDMAKDGEEALEMYKDFKVRNRIYYDLVITDINMPRLNGIAMSEKMMVLNEMQSIIFFTAFNEIAYLTQAIDLGVDGFLKKPLDQKHFSRVLYKTTKALYEARELELYYNNLENVTFELEIKNKEVEKSLRMLDKMLEQKAQSQQKNIVQKEVKAEDSQGLKKFDLDQIKDLKEEGIHELQELHSEIDTAIITILNHQDYEESLTGIIDRLSRYATILSFYSFVRAVSVGFSHLVSVMRNNNLPDDLEYRDSVFTFLETFMFVLKKWNNNILESDLEGIKFLEPSILNDIQVLESMWLNDFSSTSSDEEIEFF